jgi:hypothetical protein
VNSNRSGHGSDRSGTADQRQLLYTQYFPPDRRPVITAVDVATGQARPLRDAHPADMSWVIDSNAVIVSELSADPAAAPHVLFARRSRWESHVLRELPFDEPLASFAAPIDHSTAIVDERRQS